MARPKNGEKELSPEKRELILNGAMQEFMEHGYAGARIDKIVNAAKVSKATVYRHFAAGKEGLFAELIQRLGAAKELFHWKQQVSFEEDPAVFLKRYAIGMLDNVATDPNFLTFIRIIIGESGRFPQLSQAFVRNIQKPGLEFLTNYFSNHPKLHFADPEVAARMFIGTIIHFVIVRDVLQGGEILPIDRDRLLDNLIALLLSNAKP